MQGYTKLTFDRRDDFDYLRACGLLMKPIGQAEKEGYVHESQYNEAIKFLKGRRQSEKLRNLRKSQQQRIERNQIFNNL